VTHEAEDRVSSEPESNIPVVPGQIIGDRYRIGAIIGGGGMGIVCAATHVGLGTPVAVKLIRAGMKRGSESVLRFMNEARTAASLTGEHVARVYDVGQLESGEPYATSVLPHWRKTFSASLSNPNRASNPRTTPPESVPGVSCWCWCCNMP